MVRATICALLIASSAGVSAAQGLRETRAAEAAEAGWSALSEGRNLEAAEAFADAISAEPRDPSSHLGAGAAAHRLGQLEEARRHLQQALRIHPGYADASRLLGEIHYRTGELQEAIRVYEEALAETPTSEGLRSRLDEWQAQADLQLNFYEQQSSHFRVLFEGPADVEIAQAASDLLEESYWRIGTALSVFPDRRVTVVLYTEEQFRDITRSPDWAAGTFDGSIRVPVRDALAHREELARVLVHELVHAFVRWLAPTRVPTWLNEGLAMYFEPGGLDRIRRQLDATDDRVPPGRLGTSFEGLPEDDVRLAYAQSAEAVARIIERSGTFPIVALLQDLTRGEGFATAFEQRMFESYDSFVAGLHPRNQGLLR